MNGGEAPSQPDPRPAGSVAVTGLFVLAVLITLYVGRSLFLPVVLAVLFALLLDPAVRALGRLRIPRGLGAAAVVAVLVAGAAAGVFALSEPAAEWIARAPRSLRQVESKLRPLKGPVEMVSKATEEVEKLTSVGGQAQQVEVKGESLADTLFGGARRLAFGAAVTLILVYFLLASGDRLVAKMVLRLGSPEHRRRAVTISRHIQGDLSKFLATVAAINGALGLAVGVAMWLLGVPNPTLWGVVAAVLNFIPYLGAVAGFATLGFVGVLSFTEPLAMALPALVYLALTSIEGYLVTPLILGRRLILNPVAILLGLIFWGWMWGVAGALLAVPLLVALKIVCAHDVRLRAVGDFLGP